ncbi:MAG TPA: hypothetical protein VGQ91_02295, partial [Ideonella sp.]|nr:hypothetical protein [Ideonella sp.]
MRILELFDRLQPWVDEGEGAPAAPPIGAEDTFVGTDGDDYIQATSGNDVIDGLKGNDTIAMAGAGGDDVYLFGLGDGQDTVQRGSPITAEINTLR